MNSNTEPLPEVDLRSTSILGLPRRYRLRVLKSLLGLNICDIAQASGKVPEHAVGSAIQYPEAVDEVERTLLRLAEERLGSEPGHDPD